VCPGGLPPPTSVVVDHCDAAPCDITQGGTYSFTMDFIMGTASNQLTHYARAYVGGVDVGYEVPPALRDACKLTLEN
jgi:ML domain